MAVSCKRVGCRVPASTTLVIDARRATVTLIGVGDAPTGVTLCSVHVASVTAPVNWTLLDERDPELRLVAAAPRPRPPAGSRRRRAPDDEPFPWHHHFDDDAPEALCASTPLLSRAFRAAV
jgi:hypothetical protein